MRAQRVLGLVLGAALVVAGTACTSSRTAPSPTTRAVTTMVSAPPSARMTPTKVLKGDLSYRVFAKIVAASGLSDQLDDAERLTVFAPRDSAFNALGRRAVQRLTKDRAAAAAVVRRHAVRQSVSINDLLNRRRPLTDLNGDPVPVKFRPTSKQGPLTVGGAAVTSLEAPTANGHLVVTSGIIPPAG